MADQPGTKLFSALRPGMLEFQKENPSVHDIVTGGIEGGTGVVATDALIRGLGGAGTLGARLAETGKNVANNFRAGGRMGLLKKVAIGAGVGAAATGLIGAGVSAISTKRKDADGTNPPPHFTALVPGMILFGDRERNQEGQFIGAETAGADPNSMAAAYGPVAQQRSSMATAAIGAAGAGVGTVAGAVAAPTVKRTVRRLMRK